MIRAPVVNTVLNTLHTVRQLVRRRNAFDEAVKWADSRAASPAAGAAGREVERGGSQPDGLLNLRDLASGALWLAACARARRAANRAIAGSDAASAEAELVHLGELVKLGEVLSELGAVRPVSFRGRYLTLAGGWHDTALRKGVDAGLLEPGRTRGIPARAFLQVHIEASAAELQNREAEQREQLDAALQRGLGGTGHLDLSDADLVGLTDGMKSIWASTFGSGAVWRKTTYKVPVGRDAMTKITGFCHNATTRERIFEAYFQGFGPDVDGKVLELLRTRRKLAERLGFRTWAEKELRPLAVQDPAAAHALMDRCWADARPKLSGLVRRMEELAVAASRGRASPSARGPAGGAASSQLAHADEAFFRALVTREADTWKLAEFLPASKCLPRVLDMVGRACNVQFQEVDAPTMAGRLASGWHKSVVIYEVRDGAGGAGGALGLPGSLGFIYLDLYQRTSLLGRPAVALAGALMLCRGHAYLSMNMPEPGLGHRKLLNPEEVVAMAHELGHAVHMLCYGGRPQEFDDLPLDVKELPSTLAETIALQPGAIMQYARHFSSEGPPPDALVRAGQRDVSFFVRYLQSTSVALGLHGEAFDPREMTPADVRREAVALWQRYSAVDAHPGFSPFGEDAGLYVGQGADQIAYLLCHLRVDAILHAQKSPAAGGAVAPPARARAASTRWLNAGFAGRIRAQLLDPAFRGQYHAPPGAASVAHPLPPPPTSAAGLFAHTARLEGA